MKINNYYIIINELIIKAEKDYNIPHGEEYYSKTAFPVYIDETGDDAFDNCQTGGGDDANSLKTNYATNRPLIIKFINWKTIKNF